MICGTNAEVVELLMGGAIYQQSFPSKAEAVRWLQEMDDVGDVERAWERCRIP